MLFVDWQEPVPKPVCVFPWEVVVVIDLEVVPTLDIVRSVQSLKHVVYEYLGPFAVAPYREGRAVVDTLGCTYTCT